MSKLGVFVLWFASLGVALVSYRFFALGLETAFPDMADHIRNRNLAFLLHVSASPVALALGLFQFLPGLRRKRPGLHRWSGRAYAVTVLIGGAASLFLAFGATDRPVAAAGFGILAVLWLWTTAQAVRLAMSGDIVRHRRWMIRSFALTLAAVTLRLYLPLFVIGGDMTYLQASAYAAWLCWVPNLIIAEWYLRRDGARTAGAA